MKYAGVIVIYNPDEQLYTNIKSYIDSLSTLYIVDNSEEKNSNVEQLKCLENIVYYSMEGSKDLAADLNKGCKLATNDNFDYI